MSTRLNLQGYIHLISKHPGKSKCSKILRGDFPFMMASAMVEMTLIGRAITGWFLQESSLLPSWAHLTDTVWKQCSSLWAGLSITGASTMHGRPLGVRFAGLLSREVKWFVLPFVLAGAFSIRQIPLSQRIHYIKPLFPGIWRHQKLCLYWN